MTQNVQEHKGDSIQKPSTSPINLFKPTRAHPSALLFQFLETHTDKDGNVSLHHGTCLCELPRSSDLPLRFKGRLIGASRPYLTDTPGTNVTVWVTEGRRYITHVHQYRIEAGVFSNIYRAGVHERGPDALNWLKEDSCKGVLGSASLQAWTMACRHDPPLTDLNFEYVE